MAISIEQAYAQSWHDGLDEAAGILRAIIKWSEEHPDATEQERRETLTLDWYDAQRR